MQLDLSLFSSRLQSLFRLVRPIKGCSNRLSAEAESPLELTRMLFSMTHDVDRLVTGVVELLSLAQFRQDVDLLRLAFRRACGKNPDDTFRRIVQTESSYGTSSTWSFQTKLMSLDLIHYLVDNGCEVALHVVSPEDLRLKAKLQEEYEIEILGFRAHYHRLGHDILEVARELSYVYDSSLYGGTSPFRLPNGLLEIPITFEDGYLVHLYRNRNAKRLIEQTVRQHLDDKNAVFVFNFHNNTLARKREWELFEFVLRLGQEYGIQSTTCGKLAGGWS